MRIRVLQKYVLDNLRPLDITALSPTMNLDEDISAGAIRTSHLLVNHRIHFDPRIKDVGVFNAEAFEKAGGEKNWVFGAGDEKVYWVTCTDDYIARRKQCEWRFDGDIRRMETSKFDLVDLVIMIMIVNDNDDDNDNDDCIYLLLLYK